MAKGQLHSTGTVCKAEKSCPLEGDGGQHFDTVDQLIEHTATETGAETSELREIVSTGVGLAEAVSMARDGVLGGATPSSVSRDSQIDFSLLAIEKVANPQTPQVPATIDIDLSSASSDGLRDKFFNSLQEMLPVSSVKSDGLGSYTIVVDAESAPDDYSVLMAASIAANNAATDMGYDEDELDEFADKLKLSAALDKASANQSVSWSYEGNEFTRSGLTVEEAKAKQDELKAEGIDSSIG